MSVEECLTTEECQISPHPVCEELSASPRKQLRRQLTRATAVPGKPEVDLFLDRVFAATQHESCLHAMVLADHSANRFASQCLKR